MKYHWVGFTQGDRKNNLVLDISHQSKALESKISSNGSLNQNKNSDENFQPQIIQTNRSSTLISNMTKTQIKESCLQLLKRKISVNGTLELAVGDCVISNYRDPVIEIRNEERIVKSTQSRQAQIRRSSIVESCQQQIYLEKQASEVEKQLLLGICMSGKAK